MRHRRRRGPAHAAGSRPGPGAGAGYARGARGARTGGRSGALHRVSEPAARQPIALRVLAAWPGSSAPPVISSKADDVARSIGWPPGSPFQWEVGVADLGWGVLGVLSPTYG